jgi:hypothetical protein
MSRPLDSAGLRAHHGRMARGLTRAGVRIAAACALILISAAAAVAKGPDQAIVSGPGIEQPIAVRVPGSSTIGPDMASLIESSGIIEQLWCASCDDLSTKQPTGNLGPMYLVRYRVPALTGGPTRWVEQHAYPFAQPRPLTFVAPAQPFWHQRTVGGWYKAEPRLQHILVGIGVPNRSAVTSPWVDAASVTPFWLSAGAIAAAIAVVIAIIVGLVLLGRPWARARSAARTL